MNETIYIHYGDDKFIPEKFNEIKNEPGWSKPIGGLWASRTDADFGWKDWCSSEDFHLDSFSKSFMFTLKERSKVLEIHNKHDIDKYIINTNKLSKGIDFEKILKDGYDGVELFHGNNYNELHFSIFNSWYCDSIVILNKECIVPL